MDFEWDEAKSERNRVVRDLPFALAIELFDGQTLEQADNRRDYGEKRLQAIGLVGNLIVVCIYTDRGAARRIISLRRANRQRAQWLSCDVPVLT
ncbi:MAG: BrnT family toxin [Acetobacteraceae bacterium]|nr:BrnT family toxin [Acetobacteraceae bacterium]